MPSSRSVSAARRLAWACALLAIPAWAAAQNITPGTYRHEEFSRVQRAAFDADGAGLVTTENRAGAVSVVMRFTWSVEGGKLVQRDVAITRDKRNWVPVPNTAIEIRDITPEGFELNRTEGWTRWVRER